MSIKGYPSAGKQERLGSHFATVEPVRENQDGLSVLAHLFVYEVGTDAAETGSSTTSIVATAHAAKKGDVIRFTSGTLSGQEVKVISKTANAIVPAEDLSVAPSNGDTFQILRHKYPTVSATGGLSTSSGPTEFVLNGTATQARKDTVTPANNKPFPVELLDSSGNVNTVSVSSSALPTGAATAARQDTGNASLASLDGKLGSLGQKAMAGSAPVVIASDQSAVPVSASSLPLPTGAATAAKQDTGNTSLASIDGKLPAALTGSGNLKAALQEAIPAGSNTIGKVDVNRLTVVDLCDTPLITASGSINGSAGAFYEAVASLAATVKAIQCLDTSGSWIGVYTGTAASEALVAVIPPGADGSILELAITSGTRVALRSMEATGPASGNFAINFLG